VLCYLTVRGIQLVQGAVCTTTAWRSYRRPRLVLGTLALTALESAWVAKRCLQRRALDEPFVAAVDTAAGIAGLVALAAGTTVEDRTAWVNWMCPLTYGTAAGTSLAMPRRQALAASGLLATTYVATVASSVTAGGSQASTAIANTLSYAGYVVATDTFAGRLRRSARELEAARRAAIERGERLATERERNQQHRLLHDSALQSLEAISYGMLNEEASQAEAARAANALRRALRGESSTHADGLYDALHDLVVELAPRGLAVELVFDVARDDVRSTVVTALAEATREALANVVKHADTSTAVVNASDTEEEIVVTVRDHGVGFEPETAIRQFGLTHSMEGRLREVAGGVNVWSRPGRGTRITLRAPR
jgi:signal transduction histidine kinase